MRIPPFYRPHGKQKPPAPGEEFTQEWIYLAHLLSSIAKDLSSEKNHIKAIEQFKRAEQIWTGIISTDKRALTQLLAVTISLIREFVILGQIENAHSTCLQAIDQWEKHNLPSHQRLLLTHIRYCKALIAAELTLYDEAITEYETVFSVWKELSSEDMNTFLPIMRQVLLTLQHLYQEINEEKPVKVHQNYIIEK
jgi:tetratricopeptide (TPR) repeat protein